MAENTRRNNSQSSNYKLSRGGTPAESGPFIGIVKHNIDPTRSGRLGVYLPNFGGDENAPENWRTVSYASPFFGVTPHSGTDKGTGENVGNRHSYGFWATPPDVGVKVLCIFANGDPNFGYYIACIPEPGLTHMVPGIAASKHFKANAEEESIYGTATQLPVTEINEKDSAIAEKPRFYDENKPVHSMHATTMLQQGLIKDNIRGPINSSSQRESPSTVFGISTPGRPIYKGGMGETSVRGDLDTAKLPDVDIIGRRGGHTFIMDDGDIEGTDQLVRIRTSKGHQIMFNDADECIHIIHANGLSWAELGKEGTVDVYGANSVNVRTAGHLNLHADKDININANENVNIKGKKSVNIESDKLVQIISEKDYTLYAKMALKVKSDGTIEQQSANATKTSAGGTMSITAPIINQNSGGGANVSKPKNIVKRDLADVLFVGSEWKIADSVETITTRMPTHEPYPMHNKGVDVKISLGK
jgi:hypothetical protein